jgi:uncharacterized protein YrrD
MLHSIDNLIGFTLGATDGEIGKVKDFYFDDETWNVRYLVVETGNWLFGRKVLLSPVALQTPDWNEKIFPVNLTKDQIKHSPDIDTERPVSHQQEADLHNYYSWPINTGAGVGFMTTGMVGGVIAPGIPFADRISDEVHHHKDNIADAGTENVQHPKDNPHLRSFNDFSEYILYATDDELGEIDDFLLDSTTWQIPFLVVETGTWYSGKKVLIPTNIVKKIEWEHSAVYLDQTIASFKDITEFNYDQLKNQST